jgi:hypothetical protein
METLSQLIFSVSYFFSPENGIKNSVLAGLLIYVLVLFTYLSVIGVFIFKSSWIVDKLRLDKNSGTEDININLNPQTIITVAVIIIGGVIFIDGFALLCKSVFDYFQKKSYDTVNSWAIFNSVKALAGYLLATNSKFVVRYIVKQSQLESND